MAYICVSKRKHAQAKAAFEEANKAEEMLVTVLPDAIKRYKNLVHGLDKAMETDIGRARLSLKALLGDIRLVPAASGGHLEAELSHNPEGLMRLALQGNMGFKAGLVAGAGA